LALTVHHVVGTLRILSGLWSGSSVDTNSRAALSCHAAILFHVAQPVRKARAIMAAAAREIVFFIVVIPLFVTFPTRFIKHNRAALPPFTSPFSDRSDDSLLSCVAFLGRG
jgi:hypothetical protein